MRREVATLVVLCVLGLSSARVVDDILDQYLQQGSSGVKRTDGEGNPCTKPDEPFPCKTGGRCIPMKYVCDHNRDCDDGYDENMAVCTAASRPPVVDMMNFLDREKSWIMKPLFANKHISEVAHALAVSRNLLEFGKRLQLPRVNIRNLRKALWAVKNDRQGVLANMGMPHKAWKEVTYIFKQLIDSGFSR